MPDYQNKFKGLLLYDLSATQERLFSILKEEALLSLPAVILVGAFLTFVYDMNFGGVLKRAFIGVLALFMFNSFFSSAANIGMGVAGRLITKNNHILKTWTKAGTVRKNGFTKDKEESFLGTSIENVFGFLIWQMSNFAMWFVKMTFTISYYAPMIAIPIVAMVSILPHTSKALDGAIFSAIWIMVTPIIIAILLELISAMVVDDNLINKTALVSRALMSILFALYLVGSFIISAKMLGSSGISGGITSIGESFSTGMVSRASSLIRSKSIGLGRNFFVGGNGKQSYFKRGVINPISSLKTGVFNKSQEIKSSKQEAGVNSHLSSATIRDQSTKKEKATHVASAVLNPLKTIRGSKGVHQVSYASSNHQSNNKFDNSSRNQSSTSSSNYQAKREQFGSYRSKAIEAASLSSVNNHQNTVYRTDGSKIDLPKVSQKNKSKKEMPRIEKPKERT